VIIKYLKVICGSQCAHSKDWLASGSRFERWPLLIRSRKLCALLGPQSVLFKSNNARFSQIKDAC
jgi:hypothetical protein